MQYIRIKNWEKFQRYKKYHPPWIKLYTELLDKDEFEALADNSKALLICLWLLNSRIGNDKLRADTPWLKKKLPIRSKINLQPLIQQGFIQIVDNMNNIVPNVVRRETEQRQSRAETYTSVFETFWKLFKGRWKPKEGDYGKYEKGSKSEASIEFEKLTSTEQQKAIKGAPHSGGEFTPDCCRWLKTKRWEK